MAKLAAAPLYGWDSAFQLPGEVLRVLESEVDTDEYVIEADTLLSDDSTWQGRVIVRITDTTKWSAPFVAAFAARLSAELAYSIADSASLQKEKFVIYQEKIRQAKGVDAQEGSLRELTANQWIDSRKAGVSVPRAGG